MNEYGKRVAKKMEDYMGNPNSVAKEINDIQNAIEGVEVRGALAAGVAKSFNKSKNAEEKAEEAHEITQDLLDETFDSAALEANFEQRLNDEIANLQPEWTGFKNDVTAQLAQNEDKLEIVLTPSLFGAVGDGVEDDSVAIQQAINAVKTLNGTLDLKNNRYLISEKLELENAENVTIKGNGATLYAPNSLGSRSAIIALKKCKNIMIENIVFEGADDVVNYDSVGITNMSSKNTTIRDCTFRNFGNVCIDDSSGYYDNGQWIYGGGVTEGTLVENCVFDTFLSGILNKPYGSTTARYVNNRFYNMFGAGIKIDGEFAEDEGLKTENFMITGNYFTCPNGNSLQTTPTGIMLEENVNNIVISNNIFKDIRHSSGENADGVKIQTGQTSKQVGQVIISNNVFDGLDGSGFAMRKSTNVSADIEKVLVSNNIFKDTINGVLIRGDFGSVIEIENLPKNVLIVGNSFENNGYGVLLFNTLKVDVIGNRFTDNYIYIRYFSKDINIMSNTLTVSNHNFGVRVDGEGAEAQSENVFIDSNIINIANLSQGVTMVNVLNGVISNNTSTTLRTDGGNHIHVLDSEKTLVTSNKTFKGYRGVNMVRTTGATIKDNSFLDTNATPINESGNTNVLKTNNAFNHELMV